MVWTAVGEPENRLICSHFGQGKYSFVREKSRNVSVSCMPHVVAGPQCPAGAATRDDTGSHGHHTTLRG